MIFPAYKKVWFTELVKIAFRAQESPVVTCLHHYQQQAKILVGNPRVLDEEAATVDQKELKNEIILLSIGTNLAFKEGISLSSGWYQKERLQESITLAVSSRAIGGQTNFVSQKSTTAAQGDTDGSEKRDFLSFHPAVSLSHASPYFIQAGALIQVIPIFLLIFF